MFETKFLTLIIAPLLTATIKFISYQLNLTGDKDKITKEKLELIKSLLEKENSLYISEYKILYEETFLFLYKKIIPFNTIKFLINKHSPIRSLTTYIKTTPYIKVNNIGELSYSMPNKIRLFGKKISFPSHRMVLFTIYLIFFTVGWSMLTYSSAFWQKAVIQDNFSSFEHVINIFIVAIGTTSIIISIKSLWRAFDMPSEKVRKEDLGDIEDFIFSPTEKISKTAKSKADSFSWYFTQLIFLTFLLFFLTTAMGKATADVVLYMNNPEKQKTVKEWVIFFIGAPVFTAIWCLLWILFKNAEKKCLELFHKKVKSDDDKQ